MASMFGMSIDALEARLGELGLLWVAPSNGKV
jgi:hypothetical protein